MRYPESPTCQKHCRLPACAGLKITVKLEYTCRILCELARRHTRGELARIEELAKIEEVPANFLAQLLGELKNSGLVISKRGVQGGFLLARAPDRITLATSSRPPRASCSN